MELKLEYATEDRICAGCGCDEAWMMCPDCLDYFCDLCMTEACCEDCRPYYDTEKDSVLSDNRRHHVDRDWG